MNSIAREIFPDTSPTGLAQSLAPFFTDYQALRARLMEILSDDDLGCRVGARIRAWARYVVRSAR